MTKVAGFYYEQGLRQAEIADRLDLSQTTISRLLKRALKERIVRITVSVPLGAYPALEDALQQHYSLKEAIVVDCVEDDDERILHAIGAAAAFYLENTIKPGGVVGISSWSATLLAMVEAMHPILGRADVRVVQILGGVGNPSAEVHATRLTQRLATLVDGESTLLPAPGIVGSAEMRRIYLQDQFVTETMAFFDRITMALVGIGGAETSKLLASSGQSFTPEELSRVRRLGAVGDICLRFFDAHGAPVASPLDERVIGITLDQLKRRRRTVGIAGGQRKLAAIRAALEGGLINVLITDHFTAERLVAGADGQLESGKELSAAAE